MILFVQQDGGTFVSWALTKLWKKCEEKTILYYIVNNKGSVTHRTWIYIKFFHGKCFGDIFAREKIMLLIMFVGIHDLVLPKVSQCIANKISNQEHLSMVSALCWLVSKLLQCLACFFIWTLSCHELYNTNCLNVYSLLLRCVILDKC